MKITLEQVGYRAGDRVILDNVSLTADRGSFIAIAGPNGAGKSTLLNVVSGRARPHVGSVLVDGRSPASVPPPDLALELAYLGPLSDHVIEFTVGEVVALGRFPHRHAETSMDDAEAVTEAIGAVAISHLTDAPLHTLSTGELQRAGLARVLAQRAPLMLLDEPTANLDPGHAVAATAALRTRADEGTTILCAVHDLNVAARVADRIIILDDGVIAADGSPRQALKAELLSRVYHQPMTVIDHPTEDGPLVVV